MVFADSKTICLFLAGGLNGKKAPPEHFLVQAAGALAIHLLRELVDQFLQQRRRWSPSSPRLF